jgi:hypothetical protein
MDLTAKRLEEVAAALEKEIGKTRPDFTFPTDDFSRQRHFVLLLPYEPNIVDYDEARNLYICTKDKRGGLWEQASVEIRAHAIGSKFRGFIGVIAVFNDSSTKKVVSKETFQTTYAEPYESAERRFRPWLEESLVNALTMWRKSL